MTLFNRAHNVYILFIFLTTFVFSYQPALSFQKQPQLSKTDFNLLLDSAENIRATKPEAALKITEGLIKNPTFRTDTARWIRSLYIAHFIYAQYGNFEKALPLTLEQEKLAQKQNDTIALIRVLENLAYDYSNLNSIEESQKYRNKAISLARKSNYKSYVLAIIYSNYGDFYRTNYKNYTKALAYNDTALTISQEIAAMPEYAFLLANRSEVFIELERYNEALIYAQRARTIMDTLSKNNFYPIDYAFANRCLGSIYRQKKEYQRSLNVLNKGLEVVNGIGGIETKANLYQELANTYEAKGDLKAAIESYKSFKLYDDSLKAQQNKEAALALKFQFNIEKNAQEIEILNMDKELAQVTLEKQKSISYLLGIVLILIFALLLFVIRSYRLRKANINQLEQQNIEIQAKNAEIEAQKSTSEIQNKLLEEKNIELDHLIQENNNLIGIVAHDLKSPLKQINGLVSIIKLEGGTLNENQLVCIDKISESSARASGLISKILDLDALEAKKSSLEILPNNLSELVLKCKEQFTNQAIKKQIQLNISGTESAFIALCDTSFVLQVFENLLSNAIKFSPLEKQIHITLSETDKYIRCAIKDEGPGVNTEDMNKLFGKFQKLSARPTAGETSNGLGLSIVKKYTNAMNGNVWCESTEGEGATFIVELPKVL